MRRWGMTLVAVSVLTLASCVSMGDLVRAAMESDSGSSSAPDSTPSRGSRSTSEIKGKPLDGKAWQTKLNASSDRKVGAGVDLGQKPAGAFALQNGGWASYRVTKGGQVSLFSMATFQEKDFWIYEIVTFDKGKANAIQLVYRGFDKAVASGRPESAELVEMWTMDQDGTLSRLDGSMSGAMSGAYSRSLTPGQGATLVSGGSVTVPYGTFASTWIGTDAKSKSKAWIHSGAPFFHLVKSVSDNDGTVMELVDGASSGYQSVMPTLAERAKMLANQ